MSDAEMPDNLPDEIWVFKGAKKGKIIVDIIPGNNTAYRLKSTVDAERAELEKELLEMEGCYALEQDWRVGLKNQAKADDKTIRELAAGMSLIRKTLDAVSEDIKIPGNLDAACMKAILDTAALRIITLLQDNAPRIAQANESQMESINLTSAEAQKGKG